MDRIHLAFPIICKPDIGERGWMVQKVENENQLHSYIRQTSCAFLVQEYVDLPIEAGVFYYKSPGAKKGTVSSVVLKEMLTVTGDGHSTLQELIIRNDRAKLQWNPLKEKFNGKLTTILNAGEQMELVGIGNHCKGTKFLNGNYLINEKLTSTFDEISKNIEGFFFGRYDLRVKSIEDLYEGHIKIMELNGAGAEPAHIYHPGSSLRKAYHVLFQHWNILYEISRENHALGTPYLSLRDGWTIYRQLKQLKK
ncbi:hypothetical protein C900_04498 [Fulvivirga imtechensis AK7]|uniref:ATP-grasp domain-containing protein n=2 Tax=Fulvivirga TaxID=396811 RepID=L8JMD6_9BACT|nr:hypothetical protein C900_04498 [Fulvivirga imtechensis AK7]